MNATEGQLEAMRKELDRSLLARWQDNKPTVVLDRRDYPERGSGNYGWVLCNIGRGFAINVIQFSPADNRLRSLGGLAAGEERPVPHELDTDLRNSGNALMRQHIVIAEGPPSRTRRWNPTLNRLTSDGAFVHTLTYPMGAEDNGEIAAAEGRQGITEYVAENRERLVEQFRSLTAWI
jgi:hypothetical protein